MILDYSECEVLVQKYNSMGYSPKKLEERLQMIDPYVTLDLLKLTLSPLYFQ